jgi:ribosomal protein S18 acetylase RimI-like enzyme
VDVAEDRQRRGIASELVWRLAARARARRCGDVWLMTETGNTAARGLYRHLDAKEDAEVVLYVWEAADPLVGE